MTWDAESRISTVGGASYVYDPLGQRVGKQGVGLTDTVYFGGKPIARYSAGQWTDLIYGPTGLLAEVPGTQNGAPVYRVTDHLGSTVGSLLADGSLVNPVDYTPFGQVFSTGRPFLVRCISASRYPARVLGRRWQFCRARWSTTCRLMTIWAAAAPCIENRPFTTANQRAF